MIQVKGSIAIKSFLSQLNTSKSNEWENEFNVSGFHLWMDFIISIPVTMIDFCESWNLCQVLLIWLASLTLSMTLDRQYSNTSEHSLWKSEQHLSVYWLHWANIRCIGIDHFRIVWFHCRSVYLCMYNLRHRFDFDRNMNYYSVDFGIVSRSRADLVQPL